ncbi:Protein tyrosine phosphatase domain-containing protein 1 [Podochytrium sp. JEL0797]|nr:Protein tyrosine phosphatase domain-containing protein 1 [Podochytrium sp. JEL0797]
MIFKLTFSKSRITDSILATQRPSTRIIKQYNIIDVFKQKGIKSIFNLQLAQEHQNCGDGVDDRGGAGFSYVPEDWMNEGISHYGFGWPDMDVPEKSHILKVVQVMTHELDTLGGKVAVHCHAGLGRTGLTIACYLIYAKHMTPTEAIKCVRDARPRSVQTAKQQSFVHQFKDYLISLTAIFPMTISRPFVSVPKDPASRSSEDQEIACHQIQQLPATTKADMKSVNVVVKPISFRETMENQRLFLHGMELRTLWNVPKIVHALSMRLKSILIASSDTPETHSSLSNSICTGINAFQFNSNPTSAVLRLMSEINSGSWKVLDGPIDADVPCWQELNSDSDHQQSNERGIDDGKERAAVLVEVLLHWVSLLKDPFLSDTQVHAIIDQCESQPSITPAEAMTKVEKLDKPVFWTLNLLMDMYRHMSPGTNTAESMYRIATLLTTQRASNVPTVQSNASLAPRLSQIVNAQGSGTLTQTELPTSKSTEKLPQLPTKPDAAVPDEGRKRVASEPPKLGAIGKTGSGAFGAWGKGLVMFGGPVLQASAVWGITRLLKV